MARMPPEGKGRKHRIVVAAVSGGPDSVYLLLGKLAREKGTELLVAHVDYGMRGKDSLADKVLVEDICKKYGYKKRLLSVCIDKFPGKHEGVLRRFPSGFEKKARDVRYRFLKDLSENAGAEAIALAHTADDQVETILMRVFEGAGIGGLKGIPRETVEGIIRPILDVWKEDILIYLKKRKIPFRIDRTNLDNRFERNWIRNVLLPLLVKRYGKGVKSRIYALGERFRELDDYLEAEAGWWTRRNVKSDRTDRDSGSRKGMGATDPEKRYEFVFRRETFSALPSVLRVKILQRICFDRLGIAPNERLLKTMDRNVFAGGPSARVNVGKGWNLANRYADALFVREEDGRGRATAEAGTGGKPTVPLAVPGEYGIPLRNRSRIVILSWESKGKCTAAQAKRLAAKGDAEVFDAAGLKIPLTVRPLAPGDRIRPFGGNAGGSARSGEKRVKEILIDRKVPRGDRWGRSVVCDAEGAILWIPGVLRSAHAPVTPATRKTALLRIRSAK